MVLTLYEDVTRDLLGQACPGQMQVRTSLSGTSGSVLAMGRVLLRPMLVTVLKNLETTRGLTQNASLSMRVERFRLMGNSPAHGDSGIQAPPILWLCPPLGL